MPPDPMDDLLIRGGHVIDGSGGPGRDADVMVRAGHIAAVEPRGSVAAHRVIDARGLVEATAFIDIHTHSDFTPLPRAPVKIRQGVTLEVVGNCGFSWRPRCRAPRRCCRYLASSATWLPFHDDVRRLRGEFPSTSVNVILQVGHNTLRLIRGLRIVCSHRTRWPHGLLLEEALAGGAWGLSSGLFTARAIRRRRRDPCLARVLRRHGAAYSTHVRDEANQGLEACASRWPRPPACTCRSRTSSSPG
jgi:N-acyl-D-aspartate/D-glutamate deacylase